MKNEPTTRGVPLTPPRTSLKTQLAWGVFFVLLIWSWEGADMRPLDLIEDSANMLVEALDFVMANRRRFPFHDLVDGRYPLDRIDDAMADAAARRVLRAAVIP